MPAVIFATEGTKPVCPRSNLLTIGDKVPQLTTNVLLKILIFDVLSRTAYSPSNDQQISNADPNDLFLHASAV